MFATNGEVIPLPAGSAWVICGEDCPSLTPGAEVFYRKVGWEVNPLSKKRERKRRKAL